MQSWEQLSADEKQAFRAKAYADRGARQERESAELRAKVGGFEPLRGYTPPPPEPLPSQQVLARQRLLEAWRERHNKESWEWLEEAPESLPELSPCKDCQTLRPSNAEGPCPICNRERPQDLRQVTESYVRDRWNGSVDARYWMIVPDDTPGALGFDPIKPERYGPDSRGGKARREARPFKTLEEDRQDIREPDYRALREATRKAERIRKASGDLTPAEVERQRAAWRKDQRAATARKKAAREAVS